MSLILDALKKMEQNKARRQPRSMELGPAILQERTPVRTSRWLTPVLIVCAVIMTAAAMYLFMPPRPGNSSKHTVEQNTVEQNTVARAVPAPASTVPATSLASRPEPAESAAAPHPAAPTSPVTAPPTVVASPPPVAAAPPQLVINGIAWQEERSGRRAVVNGLLVAEGDTVAGARVSQIQPDKVIFKTGDGQRLEILHSTPYH